MSHEKKVLWRKKNGNGHMCHTAGVWVVLGPPAHGISIEGLM